MDNREARFLEPTRVSSEQAQTLRWRCLHAAAHWPRTCMRQHPSIQSQWVRAVAPTHRQPDQRRRVPVACFRLAADARVACIARSRAGSSRGAVGYPSPPRRRQPRHLSAWIHHTGSSWLWVPTGPLPHLPPAAVSISGGGRLRGRRVAAGASFPYLRPPIGLLLPCPRFRPAARVVAALAPTPPVCPHPRRRRRRCPLPASTLPAGPSHGVTHTHVPPHGTPVHSVLKRARAQQGTPPPQATPRACKQKCTAEKKKRTLPPTRNRARGAASR